MCAPLISMCASSENWCFVLLVMMVFRFGFSLVIDEMVRVFPISAEETCGHDKMRHFLREKACFKRNHVVATGSH